MLTLALSGIKEGVWLSLMPDSTSQKLILQKIREEVLARGLGPVGAVAIPRDIWEGYVPASFSEFASRHFSDVPPLSEEAHTMLRALRGQGLLPLPTPGLPGAQWKCFPDPKIGREVQLDF